MNDLKGIIEDCNKSDLVSNKVIKKIIEIVGQEEWQDLHDENSDICTTMGELIITLNGIEELEKDKQYFSDSLDKQIEATLKLQQENAELDCQKNRNKFCYSCANATEKCFKNEIGCPCDKYKSYKDENAELRNNGFTVSAMTEQQLKVALEKGEQLEKENADLKCECRRCVYTDSPCILSDYGKDRNGMCDHFKDVFDENAELKKKVEKHKWNDIFLEENAFYDKVIAEEYTTLQERIKQLEKENAELRKKCQDRCDECWEEHIKLTKATKIIKDLCGMVRELNKPNVQLTNIDYSLSEAEQFLSEVEK